MTKKFYLNKENLKELNRISLMSKTKENITYIIENIKNILTDEIITKYKSYHSYLENRNHFDEYLQELKEDNNSLKIFQTWIKKIIILERGFLLINLKSMLRKEKQDYKYNNTLEYLELVQLNKSGGYIDIQLETIGIIGGGTSIFVKNIQNITLIIDGIQTLKIPKIKMYENYDENPIEYIKSYFLRRKIELTYNCKKDGIYTFKYKELEDSKYNIIKNLISLKSTVNDLYFSALKYGINTNQIEVFYSGHQQAGSYIKSDTAAIKYVTDLEIESNREVTYLGYESSLNDTYKFVIDMKHILNEIKEKNMSSQFHGYKGEVWDLDSFKISKNNMSIFYDELKIMKELEKNTNNDLKIENHIVKYKEEDLFEVVTHREIKRLDVYRQTHKSYYVNSCFRQISSLEKINEVVNFI